MSSIYVTPEVEAINERLLTINRNSVNALNVEALADKDKGEVLSFLSLRPAHTVFMAGLILDNNLVSPLNRGEFYGYRNPKGELEGVALIGQKNVIEAQSEASFALLMGLAMEHPELQLIRGEEKRMQYLLEYLERTGRTPRVVSRELLLEQTSTLEGIEPVEGLRHATLDDLEQVMAINSSMVFEESGTNPLKRDLRGVSARTTRRIEQKRVWALAEEGKIIFKADVISHTPEAIFIEGVYVHPEERGRGIGARCMTELGRLLLKQAAAITLVVNQENRRALALYNKVNYRLRSPYLTVYF
ncbi:MAG TPA: GNAT family N-acetyltransferase [Pyrinomonadaceae bacterium]|jgi:ribosomal protein S18 acetylase RimI-like enzyme